MGTRLAKDLRVSEPTLELLKCIESLQELYSQVGKALDLVCLNGMVVESIMDEEGGFSDTYSKMREIIEGYISTSIRERMSSIHDINEI